MEDVLYYSHARIALEDIQTVAAGLGYSCVFVPFGDGSVNLTIAFGGKLLALRGHEYEWIEDHWYVDEVTPLEWEQAAEYEEEDVYATVNSYHPISMFTFGFHQQHLLELTEFLRLLLTRYGGQVMVDAENVYSEGDIKNLFQCNN